MQRACTDADVAADVTVISFSHDEMSAEPGRMRVKIGGAGLCVEDKFELCGRDLTNEIRYEYRLIRGAGHSSTCTSVSERDIEFAVPQGTPSDECKPTSLGVVRCEYEDG